MEITDILMEYLRYMDNEESHSHRNDDGSDKSFHASTFFTCYRKRILARKPGLIRTPTEAPLLFRFRQGHLFEEIMAHSLMWAGVLLESEVPVRDGEFSGRIDFVVASMDRIGIVELKTVHPFALDKIKRDGLYKHHRAQVMWYYDIMKKTEAWKEVDFMKLIYVGIADSRVLEFNIPYDPVFMEEIEKDKAILLDYYNIGATPPCLEKGNWQCKGRCEFYENYCREEQDA